MLSRAATSLTLFGRHLERADHLARILGVHVALALDRTDEPGPDFWTRFMQLAGWQGSDTGRKDEAVEMVIAGTLGPSVRASIAAARLAAQAVRPSLPSELYEHVNTLHWRVQGADWEPDLYPLLNDVQWGVRLADGLLEDPMSHDEARDFVRLGKSVERASNVTRIDGKGRRSRPRHLLIRFRSLFARANTEAIAQRPKDFDAECRGILRQLEVALRETYFHPSKVPTGVTGDEERAMPQQQQQQHGQAMT